MEEGGQGAGFLNVAGYKFVGLDGPRLEEVRQALREALRARRPHPRSPPASLCPPLPREHDDEVVKDEVGKDEDEGDVVGTVYLAQEGINAFLAGKEDVLRRALKAIEAVDELKGMEWKESWSTTLPFDKLVIRKKKEIIALGFPLLPTAAVATNSNTPATTSSSEPESGTSKTLRSECGEGTSGSGWRGEHEDYVEPRELARWLEEGREVTLLDTRNDYEWRLGGLRGSLRLPIHSFREFPSALHHLLSSPSSSSSSSSSSSPPSSLPSSSPFSSSSSSGSEAAIHTTAQKREQCVREPDEKQEKAKEKEEERAKEGEVNEGGSSGDALKERTVVIYCTGGVRCEKAAPLLRDKFGFAHVYQLHGGILKYFEEVGDYHYDGACYVFDKRLALGPDLRPVASLTQCQSCRSPLTAADRESSMFSATSCPYCPTPKPNTDEEIQSVMG